MPRVAELQPGFGDARQNPWICMSIAKGRILSQSQGPMPHTKGLQRGYGAAPANTQFSNVKLPRERGPVLYGAA